MAYNPEKHRHECDRCGTPIAGSKTLCDKCSRYLEEYMQTLRSQKAKKRNVDQIM